MKGRPRVWMVAPHPFRADYSTTDLIEQDVRFARVARCPTLNSLRAGSLLPSSIMPPLSYSERIPCPRCLEHTGEYLQGVSMATKRSHFRCDMCTHAWIDEDPLNHTSSLPPKTAPLK